MFESIEVHKLDPKFSWIEWIAWDSVNDGSEVIRLVLDEDPSKMAHNFATRYMAKRDQVFTVPDSQMRLIKDLCEEAAMAATVYKNQGESPDLVDLLPTTILNFRYVERTTFRKSRAARISMFCEDAMDALGERNFERVVQRLNWVHHLDPKHEFAFQMKVVALRNWRKMAECIPVLEAWVRTYPQDTEPRLGLGEMWLFLGQNQKAHDVFEDMLRLEANQPMALIGQAQAKARMGEDPSAIIRKSWMLDRDYTVAMIEGRFDFRMPAPDDLEAATIKDVSRRYQIPLKRTLARAAAGTLPMHAPEEEGGLLRFSKQELDRHYNVLRALGLELVPIKKEEPQPVQPGLFDDID